MRSNLICAGLLALCSSVATVTANAAEWSFTYTGFFNEESGAFLSDWTLDGSFAGVDRNGDGMLVADELTSLRVGHLDYIQCRSDDYMTCGTKAFAFKLPGAASAKAGEMSLMSALSVEPVLTFELGFDARDPEWFAGAGRTIKTGHSDYSFHRDPGRFIQNTYSWRDDTLLAITPVPEPSSWAMLGAGLAALALAGRRRQESRRHG